jgi:murein peptide amidase A
MSSPPAASVLNPVDFCTHLEASAHAAGFRVERFGWMAGAPLVGLTRRTPGPRPRIYISAGIHGDEPAPPLALLELLEAGVFDERAVWFICPLLNPVGFLRRTRENADGLDLNRDYRTLRSLEIQAHARWLQRQPNFDLGLCVHEDWEARGYYLYEFNPASRPSLAPRILEAVTRVCPLETATVIDGRAIDAPGIIRPLVDPQLRDARPEAIYLRAHHTSLGYTLETPSSLPLAQRIAAHGAAIEAAISGLTPAPRRSTGAETAGGAELPQILRERR